MVRHSESDVVRRLRDLLAASGKRLTRQRVTVLGVIEEARGHLHAEDLYRLARARDQRISLSTVYRTLALLKACDLVVERRFDEEHRHYEVKHADDHYHFVCARCGRVDDFQNSQLDQLLHQTGRAHRFAVMRIAIELSGVCSICQQSNADQTRA